MAIAQKASAQFRDLFALSWSHYVFLMAIPNPDERQFYEIEAADNGWSLPELKRQFNSGLYERLSLSRDKGPQPVSCISVAALDGRGGGYMSLDTNLHGRLRNTSLPASSGLLPLFEAVINGIHAVEDAGLSSEQGRIVVQIIRDAQAEMEFEAETKRPG